MLPDPPPDIRRQRRRGRIFLLAFCTTNLVLLLLLLLLLVHQQGDTRADMDRYVQLDGLLAGRQNAVREIRAALQQSHPAGDVLLKTLVERLRQCDQRAMPFRLGGDEFAVLLPCRDDSGVADYCRQLMETVAAPPCPHPAHPDSDRVTVSVGATLFEASHEALTRAYGAADGALYAVKSRGRGDWLLASATAPCFSLAQSV